MSTTKRAEAPSSVCRQRSRRPAAISCVVMIALQAAIATPYAYFTLFSTFQPWDDEGTIMHWDRHLLEGNALYDQVWNIYGPVPYLLRYVLHAFIGMPLSHDAYRFTTLGLWLGAAMLYSLATYRMTRSLSTAALAHFLTLACLTSITNEPGHAQGYVALLLGVVLLLGTAEKAAPRLSCVALGAMAAVMVLTKVNAGAFLGVALAMALVALTPATGVGVAARLAVGAALLTLFPSILSSVASGAGWWDFAVAGTTGLLLTYVMALSRRREEITIRDCVWALTGAVLATAVITGLTNVLLGSSLRAFLDAVFIQSWKHPAWLSQPGLDVSRVATLGGAFAWVLLAAVRRAPGPWYGVMAAGFQTVFGAAILFETFAGWHPYVYSTLLGWTLPFLWLTVITGDSEDHERATLFPRLVLASCAGTQALYVFPYAGSQLAFATVLIYLCGVVCLHGGLRRLVGVFSAEWAARRLPAAGAAVVAVWLVAANAGLARHAHASWALAVPLNLPGARYVRLAEIQVAWFRWLAYNLAANCDTFLGVPPFESMYLWTGMPAPTTLGGRWFLTSDDVQQRGIIDDFRRYQRRCVIRNELQMRYWLSHRSRSRPAQGATLPLLTYLAREFVPTGHTRGLHTWQLLVEKDRHPPELIYSARVVDPPGQLASRGRPSRISLRLPPSDGPAVTRFQIYDPLRAAVIADSIPGPDAPLLSVLLADVTSRGAAPQPLQGPLQRTVPRQLTLVAPIKTIAPFAVVRLYDATGLLVDSVPFLDS